MESYWKVVKMVELAEIGKINKLQQKALKWKDEEL